VADYNKASERLIRGLGMRPSHKVTWLVSLPLNDQSAPPAIADRVTALAGGAAAVAPSPAATSYSTSAATAGTCTLTRLHLFPFRALSQSTDQPETWDALVALLNASYSADDAAFRLDPTRTSKSEVQAMAESGTFFVAFADVSQPPVTESTETGTCAGGDHYHCMQVIESCNEETRENRGQAIAAVYVSVNPTTQEASLSLLATASEYKRMGLGRRTLKFAVAQATQLLEEHQRSVGASSLGSVNAHVVSIKPWLLNLYLSLGFTIVGQEDFPLEWAEGLLRPVFFHLVRLELR
jgi:GNAT superfamily N-acetyltransferase